MVEIASDRSVTVQESRIIFAIDKGDNMGRNIFCSLLLIILAPSVLPAQEPVIVHTDLVTLRATVMDAKGNYVLGLEKSAFTIQDNDTPQKITAFSDEDT